MTINDFPSDDTDSAYLIGAWEDAAEEFNAIAMTLDDDEWNQSSKLDGWTVGDIVAHVAHLDGLLAGEPQADYAPDWTVLTHAQTPFQKLTEYGVDLRRSRSKQEVLAELQHVVDLRREQLATADTSASFQFLGAELKFNRIMRRRTLDTWVHTMDLCFALDRPYPAQDGPAARVTAGMWIDALPRMLAKEAAAPEGSVLRLVVTGPDVQFERSFAVDSGQRGMFVASTEPAQATIAMSWFHFFALAAGRIPREVLEDDIDIEGDQALADAYLSVINMTP
jgi:uncharacterized protein (TIGR03083 family)